MKDLIIAVILIIIFALAIGYIVKEKKSGAKCIGCPHSKECGGKCNIDKPKTDL